MKVEDQILYGYILLINVLPILFYLILVCYMLCVCFYICIYTHRASMFFLYLKERHLRTFHFRPGKVNVILKNHHFVPIMFIIKCNIW